MLHNKKVCYLAQSNLLYGLPQGQPMKLRPLGPLDQPLNLGQQEVADSNHD